MAQLLPGQESKQSTADLLGWNSAPDVPETGRCRMYYNSVNNSFHVIDSTGTDILSGGGGVSLSPIADQTIAGPFTLVIAGGALQITPVLFSTLPAASSSNEGMLRAITDSTTATWGATITGGGTNHVLAYSDGTNWTVAAK